jgi:hypothetical protein
MSIKKLFEKNKQTDRVNKYLKKSAPGSLGDGIESAAHLSESIIKSQFFLPPLDYSIPENFVKFASAEKYYTDAYDYISGSYPYDGSSLEKTVFYNELNPLEKYILDEQYPRATGYAVFGTPEYSTPISDSSGFYSSSVGYIQTKGGPHLNTIYNYADNRTNNLEFGGPSGSTVEFYLKKDWTVTQVTSSREVIFDVANGNLSSSHDYGRLTISLCSEYQDRFFVTMFSGSTGFTDLSVPATGGISIGDNNWNQFSLVFDTSGSTTNISLYQSGTCVGPEIVQAKDINTVTGSLVSNIGGLREAPAGLGATSYPSMLGWGKLSGSIDEFRFWKSARNSQEVGRYWFTEVYGGSNKHLSNVDLGVYYKFNEGITNNTGIDNIILDYSGRISNGLYVNYATSDRHSGSAINAVALSASLPFYEFGDPIIRGANPQLTSSKEAQAAIGREYDYNNTAQVINTFPAWIYEEDEKNGQELKNITQLVASYFDTLYAQIGALSRVKNTNYASGSATGSMGQFPYNDRLLESMGFGAPEIFQNATVMEQLLQRSDDMDFDQSLPDIKNTIYKNIYNNLTYILKSKGSEKAIRNLIRCFGVDEEIISLNTYANNQDYDLSTEYKAGVSNKKYVDFSGLTSAQSCEGSVYQDFDDGNPNSVSIITGSTALGQYAFTVEGEFLFPDRSAAKHLPYEAPGIETVSLYGFHSPLTASLTASDTTWASYPNDHGLQVRAIKRASVFSEVVNPLSDCKDVAFAVYDRAGSLILSSSVFQNVYENKKWNFALSVRPTKYQFANGVGGTTIDSQAGHYKLEFYGVNFESGQKENSFYLTSSLTSASGSAIIGANKKLFLGSHRTNFTGTVETYTDVRASSLLYWSDYIPTGTVDQHSRDADNFGRLNPYQYAYGFQTGSADTYIPAIETLVLNWDFADVTGSNLSGQFLVADYSSGSYDRTISGSSGYENIYEGMPFSNITMGQHTGRGRFFSTGSAPVQKQYLYTDQTQLPEYVASSDMVNVLDHDVEVFKPNRRPTNYYFALEKSMYRSISMRMLQMFASIDDMNNLIGEPVNKYRPNYKSMEKLREIFFRKVGNVPDLEKYIDYYRWIDSSMGEMIQELFPASSRHSEEVRTVVESHMLERPKYQYHFLGNKKLNNYPGPLGDGVVRASGFSNNPHTRGWRYNHAPISEDRTSAATIPVLSQEVNGFWWRYRALPTSFGSPLSRSIDPVVDQGINSNRASILTAAQSEFTSSQKPYIAAGLGADQEEEVIIQQQFRSRRSPAGDFTFDDFQILPEPLSPLLPTEKRRVPFRVTLGDRNYSGRELSPFVAVSSSVTTGYRGSYNSSFPNVDFTNLHQDNIIDQGLSRPLQGPFTNEYVGGLQARHQRLLSQPGSYGLTDRAEQYRLIIGGAGASAVGTIKTIVTGTIPKGQYLRGAGPKSPINIRNIKTYTGSIGPLSGVMPIGNYRQTYEIFQSNDRSLTNIDFVFNNSNYYTGSIPTAFLTTPARRALGRTGSVDYLSPRQTGSVRTNQAIIVQQFSAPGSKEDSKQQFRDIPSDQTSPNNALPFRNMGVRRRGTSGGTFTAGGGLGGFLTTTSQWGGFVYDIRTQGMLPTFGPNSLDTIFNAGNTPATWTTLNGGAGDANIIAGPSQAGMASPFHKTQRNTTNRIVQRGYLMLATGSTTDNALVTRPIPQADRSQWFLSLSGSDAIGIENFNNYILSGSRYPVSMTATTSSLSGTLGENNPTFAAAAMGILTVTSFNDAQWNLKEFALEDTAGLTYTFQAKASDALNSYTRSSTREYTYGVASATSIADILATISNALTRATNGPTDGIPGDNMPMNNSTASPRILILQNVVGVAGNTTITGDWASGTAVGSFTSFAGGADATAAPTQRDFAGSVITGSNGSINYIWDNEIGFFPATQLQAGNSWQAKYLRKNNLFQILPAVTGVDKRTKKFVKGTLTSSLHDRAGNSITSRFSQQLTEPPLTSKYKPLVHTIKTYRGTAEETDYKQKMTVGVEYSYGNDLQAFANRDITYNLGNPTTYSEGKIKRPYEVLRHQYLSDVSRGVTGVDKIEGMTYSETIYPKEIYTYLSGTRARQCFVINFWKPDHPTNIDASSGVFSKVSNLYESAIVDQNVFTLNRLKSPFTSSQGYVLRNVEQWPWHRASDIISLADINFPGTGSVWPMDSFMYSELVSRFSTAVGFSGGVGTAIDLYPAAASAMASGELMTTKYGHVVDERGFGGPTGSPTGSTFYGTSSIIAAQYVYSVPTMFRLGDSLGTPQVDPYRFGGIPTRPTWDTGRKRKNIQPGANEPIFINTRYPFYRSYEEFAEDIRVKSKDSTLVPEFRISEHMHSYQNQTNVMVSFSGTLSLTGASKDLTSSAQPQFFNRYTTTDFHEYLQSFMGYRTKDLQFNKQPRQFEMSSEATMKLLPYEGFYPQLRTLELATLFSQSYSSHISYSGPNGQGARLGGHSNQPERFRPILDPFFSPGILFNSIKSGIAVDYPVRRAGQSVAWNSTGSNFNPLQGPLTASWTIMAAGSPGINYGEIPGGRRRRQVNGSSDFNFTSEATADFFWSDRVPFEALLKPMEEISDLKPPLMSSDFNADIMIHVSASALTSGSINDVLYRSAISNFLASVPEFFLSEKPDGGYMTKFVAKIPQKNSTTDPLGVSAAPQTEPRTVTVSSNTAYMMEIGLRKSENFNMYSNPYAFGPPTATGSANWLGTPLATTASRGQYPEGKPWPLHRGEFAPFTPPYYYGPSLARITYMPRQDKDVTLTQILNSDEIFVDFVNSDGRYYDFSSGSFASLSSSVAIRGEGTPNYLWNRAWVNRMDLDASVVIDNMFPTEMGGKIKPFDSNKWVVMPKWECPVLDFPRDGTQLETPWSPNGSVFTPADLSGAILRLELSNQVYEATIDSNTTIANSNRHVIGLQDATDSTLDFSRATAISLNDARINAGFPILEVEDFNNPLTVIPTVKQVMNFTGSAINPGVGTLGSKVSAYSSYTTPYNFSSSVTGAFTNNAGQPNWTQGMWHQYGTMPSEGEGLHLFVADINSKSSEFRLCGLDTGAAGGLVESVRKVPLYVVESSRSIGSLANLVGFKKEEIMPANQWIPERAKAVGQLAPDGEKTISEAIVAMPYYLDPKTGDIRSMTLRASSVALGPKIKEFRRSFTKYSLPPSLRNELTSLLPPDYPAVPDFINPFGGDDYDEILSPADLISVPVVYLMEHTTRLSRQDLGDIWQGVMPEISNKMDITVSSIDHYMPGMVSENSTAVFPEILEKQLDLGLPQTGVPRVDLLDTTVINDWNGFVPEIKWMVFRVKQRGPTNYTSMILQEINDGKSTENFNTLFGYLAEDLPPGARKSLEANKNQYTKNLYNTENLGSGRNTYNWPYDYCSLIELANITTTTTFRPDLDLGEPQDPPKGPPPFEGPVLGGRNNMNNLLSLAGRLGNGVQNLNLQPIAPVKSGLTNEISQVPLVIQPQQFVSPPKPLTPTVKPTPPQPIISAQISQVAPLTRVNNFKYTLKPNTSPNNNRKQVFQLKRNISQQKINNVSKMGRKKINLKRSPGMFNISRKKY